MAEAKDSNAGVQSIALCGTKGCCPTVEVSDNVVIADDFGGKVTLTKAQWREAVGKVIV